MRTKLNPLHICTYCNKEYRGGLETLKNLWNKGHCYICPDCFKRFFSQCDYCENDIHKLNSRTLSNGRHACPDCYRALKAQGKA